MCDCVIEPQLNASLLGISLCLIRPDSLQSLPSLPSLQSHSENTSLFILSSVNSIWGGRPDVGAQFSDDWLHLTSSPAVMSEQRSATCLELRRSRPHSCTTSLQVFPSLAPAHLPLPTSLGFVPPVSRCGLAAFIVSTCAHRPFDWKQSSVPFGQNPLFMDFVFEPRGSL